MIFFAILYLSFLIEDIPLPDLNDPRLIKEADAIENDPRSRLNEENRKLRLKEELAGIGLVLQSQKKYQKALLAFNESLRLEKNPTNFLRRGYLHAIMGNWQEAEKDFRTAEDGRSLRSREIAEFCLANGRPDIARHYEAPLRKQYTDPECTRTLSKICMQTGRADEGRTLCKRAYYLDWAFGNDLTESQKLFKHINGYLYPKIDGMNKSSEKVFWNTVDKLIAKGKYCSSEETRALLKNPSYVYGYVIRGQVKLDFSFAAQDADAPIKLAGLLLVDSKPHGVSLEPNVLCCCLSKDDAIKYLKARKFNTESFEPPAEYHRRSYRISHPVSTYEKPERTFDSVTDWGKLKFVFNRKGPAALKRLEIFFNQGGPPLLPPIRMPVEKPKNWEEELETAKELLGKKNYRACRDQLCRTLLLWQLPSDHGRIPVPIERKPEYETIKQLFVTLYTEWKRPEIAQFFKETSLRQLVSECYAVGVDEKHEDFPTVTEFRHTMWTIESKEFRSYISLQIPGCMERNVLTGSKLYTRLNELLKHGSKITIFPVEAELLDSEDFTQPNSSPANTPDKS